MAVGVSRVSEKRLIVNKEERFVCRQAGLLAGLVLFVLLLLLPSHLSLTHTHFTTAEFTMSVSNTNLGRV